MFYRIFPINWQTLPHTSSLSRLLGSLNSSSGWIPKNLPQVIVTHLNWNGFLFPPLFFMVGYQYFSMHFLNICIYIYTIYYVSAFSLLHPLNLHLPVAYHTANWKLQLQMVPKRYPNLSLVNGSWFPRSKSGSFLKWRYPLASSILFSDLPLQTVQLLKFWGVSPKKIG